MHCKPMSFNIREKQTTILDEKLNYYYQLLYNDIGKNKELCSRVRFGQYLRFRIFYSIFEGSSTKFFVITHRECLYRVLTL